MREAVLMGFHHQQVSQVTGSNRPAPFQELGDVSVERTCEQPELFGRFKLAVRLSTGAKALALRLKHDPETVVWRHRQGSEPSPLSGLDFVDCASRPQPSTMLETLRTFPASREQGQRERAFRLELRWESNRRDFHRLRTRKPVRAVSPDTLIEQVIPRGLAGHDAFASGVPPFGGFPPLHRGGIINRLMNGHDLSLVQDISSPRLRRISPAVSHERAPCQGTLRSTALTGPRARAPSRALSAAIPPLTPFRLRAVGME